MRIFKQIHMLALAAVVTLLISACGAYYEEDASAEEINSYEEDASADENDSYAESAPAEVDGAYASLDEYEYYYDVENVVLYLDTYDHLPYNYITKKEAEALGWSGGQVSGYKEGAAIGGDYFGNYEKLLPTDAQYRECDIDTINYKDRGSRRLIYSDTEHYYYTTDHYKTFTEVEVLDGQIVYGEKY